MTKKPTKEEKEKWEVHIKNHDDEKYPLAVDAVLKAKDDYPENEAYTSVSYLQRKLRVGYTQAQRLIVRMVQDNVLQPEPTDTYVRYKIIG